MRATMVLFTILGVAVLGRTAAAEDARLAASRDIASGMQAALKGELAQAMTTAGSPVRRVSASAMCAAAASCRGTIRCMSNSAPNRSNASKKIMYVPSVMA